MKHRQCKFCKNTLSWEHYWLHDLNDINRRTSRCKHCGWSEFKEILKEKYD